MQCRRHGRCLSAGGLPHAHGDDPTGSVVIDDPGEVSWHLGQGIRSPRRSYRHLQAGLLGGGAGVNLGHLDRTAPDESGTPSSSIPRHGSGMDETAPEVVP